MQMSFMAKWMTCTAPTYLGASWNPKPASKDCGETKEWQKLRFHPPEWWLSWRAWWTANLPFWAQEGQYTSIDNFGTRRTCIPYWSKTTGIRTACAHASTVRQYQKNIFIPCCREEGSSGHSWWYWAEPWQRLERLTVAWPPPDHSCSQHHQPPSSFH